MKTFTWPEAVRFLTEHYTKNGHHCNQVVDPNSCCPLAHSGGPIAPRDTFQCDCIIRGLHHMLASGRITSLYDSTVYGAEFARWQASGYNKGAVDIEYKSTLEYPEPANLDECLAKINEARGASFLETNSSWRMTRENRR